MLYEGLKGSFLLLLAFCVIQGWMNTEPQYSDGLFASGNERQVGQYQATFEREREIIFWYRPGTEEELVTDADLYPGFKVAKGDDGKFSVLAIGLKPDQYAEALKFVRARHPTWDIPESVTAAPNPKQTAEPIRNELVRLVKNLQKP